MYRIEFDESLERGAAVIDYDGEGLAEGMTIRINPDPWMGTVYAFNDQIRGRILSALEVQHAGAVTR